jgi:TP901 family phage tail tape measure protein
VARKLQVEIVGDSSSLERAFGRAAGQTSRFGSSLGRLGRMAGLAVTGGLALAAGASVKLAGDYQASMNILQAVTKGTDAQMKAFGRRAMQLGADLTLPATSAKDAADAMTELAKGGLTVTQTMRAAKGVLQLSAAAQISNAEAATITARALKSFGLAGSEAIRVADVLANAANKSTGEITDFAAGLSDSSAVAHSYGLTINETTAALMQLADAGIVGADGGTTLKTMLLRLTPTTAAAKEEFKKLGINTYNAAGQFVGIRSVIGQFHDALAKLTPEQRQQAEATVFGSRAIRGANILLGDGVKAFDAYLHATQQQGAAADLAAARMKGFKGALAGLQSQAETMAISFGLKLLPALTAGLNVINRVFGAKTMKLRFEIAWDSLKSGLENVRTFFLGKTIQIRGFDMGGMETAQTQGLVQKIQAALAGANWGGVGASVAAGLMAAITAGLSAGSGLAAALQGVISGALTSMDWGPIVGSMGPALAAAFVNMLATFASPGFWMDHIGALITIGLLAIPLDAIAAQFGLKFVRIFTKPLADLAKFILGGLGDIGKLIGRSFLDVIAPEAEAGARALVAKIIGGLRALPGQIASVMQEAARSVGRAFGFAVVDAARAAADVVKAIVNGLRRLFPQVEAAMKVSANAIRGRAAEWASSGILLALRLVAGVRTGLGSLVGVVIAKLTEISGAISSVAGMAFGWAMSIGRAIADGILSGITGLAGRLAGALGSAVSGAISHAKSLMQIHSPSEVTKKEIGKPLGEGIVIGFLLGSNDLPAKVSQKLRDALQAGQQVIQNAQSAFGTAFSRLGDYALRAFDAKTDQMLARIQSKYDKARAIIDALLAVKLAGISERAGGETPAEKQLREEGDARAEEQRQRAIAQAQQQLAEAQAKLAEAQAGGDAEAIKSAQAAKVSAQQALDDALYAEHQAALEKQAAAERKAKDEQAALDATYAQAEADRKKAAADKRQAEEEKQTGARRALQRQQLEDMLNDLEKMLEKHPEKWRKLQKIIGGVFAEFGITYKQAGKNLGVAFAEGMEQAFDKVEKTAKAIAALVEKYLRVKSPTKAGPMSDLDTWWAKLPETLVGSMNVSDITGGLDAVGKKLRDSLAVVGGDGGSIANAVVGGGRSRHGHGLSSHWVGPPVGGDVHVHFHGPVIGTGLEQAAHELTPHIRAGLLRTKGRNGSLGLG